MLHRPAVRPALQARGVLGHDLYVRDHVLPDAGRRHEEGGADLAHVLARRVRLLGEVDREPREQPAGHRHHLLPDPGEGQERHEFVARIHRVHAPQLGRHRQQVLVREHGQLGDAGRARGRAQERDVAGPDRGELLVELLRGSRVPALTQRLDLLEGHQTGCFVAVHPPRIVVDDVLEAGQSVPHLQHLVDLLLILGDDDSRLGGLEHPRQLPGDGVLIESERQNAAGLGRELGDHPFRPVVPDDRDPVPPLDPQLRQSQREGAHPAEVLRPGDLLPDAELLLSQRDLVGAFVGVARKEARKRLVHGAASSRPACPAATGARAISGLPPR